MRLNLIAAIDQTNVLGYGNAIPWHLSGDLKFFKRTTMGHCIIMGRATFDSLGGEPLPGRDNIVLTHANPSTADAQVSCRAVAGGKHLYFAGSIEAALQQADSGAQQSEVFFIGGASVYAQVINRVSRMYLTHVNGRFKGDTWFPDFNQQDWSVQVIDDHWDALPHGWRVVCYERICDVSQ